VTTEAKDHDRDVSYLLGSLSEDERIEVEREIFASDSRYEQVLALEDELMYDYLQGGLSAEERRRFEERFFSTPEGERRAMFAKSLLGALPDAKAMAKPPARPAWAGWTREWLPRVAALLLATSSGLAIATVRLLRENAQLRTEQARAAQDTAQIASARSETERLTAELAREKEARKGPDASGSRPSGVLSFLLTSGLTRSPGQWPRLLIPKGTERVRLQLEQARWGLYPAYRATISTAEGTQVWGGHLGPSAGKTLILEIPARVLPTADYELVLTGVPPQGPPAELATYDFGVVVR